MADFSLAGKAEDDRRDAAAPRGHSDHTSAGRAWRGSAAGRGAAGERGDTRGAPRARIRRSRAWGAARPLAKFALFSECSTKTTPLTLLHAAISSRVTASHPNSEVKLDRDRVVLRWGTTREGRLLSVLPLRERTCTRCALAHREIRSCPTFCFFINPPHSTGPQSVHRAPRPPTTAHTSHMPHMPVMHAARRHMRIFLIVALRSRASPASQ